MFKRKPAFMIYVKAEESILFGQESKHSEVEKWIASFDKSRADEIKVYRKNADNPAWELYYSDSHRRIGFGE